MNRRAFLAAIPAVGGIGLATSRSASADTSGLNGLIGLVSVPHPRHLAAMFKGHPVRGVVATHVEDGWMLLRIDGVGGLFQLYQPGFTVERITTPIDWEGAPSWRFCGLHRHLWLSVGATLMNAPCPRRAKA
jgi:hypothetical protein